MKSEYVGMVELGGNADFPQESLASQDGREFGPHDLYCDIAVMLEVVRQVDRGHATLAQLPFDCVSIGQGRLQTLELISHRG
jgi:hypothetical protein